MAVSSNSKTEMWEESSGKGKKKASLANFHWFIGSRVMGWGGRPTSKFMSLGQI